MKPLSRSLLWRLVFWTLILLLIPLGAVFISMQQNLRTNLITARREVLRSQAQVYYTRVTLSPGQEQEISVELVEKTNGNQFSLIGNDGIYIANSNAEKVGQAASTDFGTSLLQQMLEGKSVTFQDDQKGLLIGTYRSSLIAPLAITVGRLSQIDPQLQRYSATVLTQFLVALFFVLAGTGLAMRSFLSPLNKLSNYVDEMERGHLTAELDAKGLRGELSELATSLKKLASRLQSSSIDVETRINDRAREAERQSHLLRAVAAVGKIVTSFRNLSELLNQTTVLIHENFNFYHVGIFMLDEHREHALLMASNSEGGQRMLEKKHQLKIGGKSIVGFAIENAQARIALDVGQDAVYFDNPELPSTRSEMALPLVVGGQILGALDVQSTEAQAFKPEDIATLQVLADQIAVAIQNANLFNETEKALESARLVYGEISREAWRRTIKNQPRVGFIATPPGTVQTYSEPSDPSVLRAYETGDLILENDGLTICLPIKIRGQVIGTIRLKKSDIADSWTQEETNLAVSLSDQLSGALDSARLYRESQQRVARESLVSDISARISSASQIDTILRETVSELGQALGNASVTFQLVDQEKDPGPANGNRSGKNGKGGEQT